MSGRGREGSSKIAVMSFNDCHYYRCVTVYIVRSITMRTGVYSTHTHTCSDITIAVGDRKMPAHRFVLAARSRHWSPDETLASTDELDLSHMTPFVASSLIRWVYMDTILLPSDQTAMIELLAASDKYHLAQLKEK